MIPKVIHYCWFGENPLPENVINIIDSWKRHCPDFIIKEWNEANFDINCNDYVKEAYEAKKWAYVTDYVRLYAMVSEGGIYMDTDVEVIKPLDSFLSNQAFSGFENDEYISTGIMGCEKDFPLFKILLNDYNNRHFKLKNGDYDLTTNVITISNICKKYGYLPNNKLQTVEGFVIYPKDWFCPKDYDTNQINLTDNTHTIHHFSGTWMDKYSKIIKKIEWFIRDKVKGQFAEILIKIAILPVRVLRKLNKMFTKIVNK